MSKDKRQRVNSQYQTQSNKIMQTNRDQQSDIQSMISQSLEKVNEVLSSKRLLASFRRASSNYSPDPVKGEEKHQNSTKFEQLPNVEVEECEFEVIPPRDNKIFKEQLYNSIGPSGQTPKLEHSMNLMTRQGTYMNATHIVTDDENMKQLSANKIVATPSSIQKQIITKQESTKIASVQSFKKGPGISHFKTTSIGGNNETPVRMSKVQQNLDVGQRSKPIKTTLRKQWNVNQKIEIYSKNESGEIKLYDGLSSAVKLKEQTIKAREQLNDSRQALSQRNLITNPSTSRRNVIEKQAKIHVVKNIDLGRITDEPLVPTANTTRHRKTVSKDAGMFDLDLPDEASPIQRAKVSQNTKKFMKNGKEVASTKNARKLSSKKITVQKSQFIFDQEVSKKMSSTNLQQETGLKTKTKKISKDFGVNESTNSLTDLGKIKQQISTLGKTR